jgi:hypothetical protein
LSSVWVSALVASSANVKRTREGTPAAVTQQQATIPGRAARGQNGGGPQPSGAVDPQRYAASAYSAVPTHPTPGSSVTKVTGRCLLAGSKQTGRQGEIPSRHASRMANGAHTSTTRAGHGPRGRGRRTIDRPPSGLRTDLTVTAGPVYRLGEEKSRCAPDGGTAENASVTWERVDAEDGGLRACPSVDRPATPRLLELDTEAPAG